MPEFRCQQCHASCEAEETPSTCPICGAAREEAFLAVPLAGRDSVENLFDLEPLDGRPTKSGGEPARLKDRPGAPPALGDPPAAGPLSTTPTLVEESSEQTPLMASSTLELEDSDLNPEAPPPPFPAAPAPASPGPAPATAAASVSTGVTRIDLLTTGRLSSGLSSLSTLGSGVASLEGSEAGRDTVDLDESDLEQVSEGGARPPATPAPAPHAPAPPKVVSPRSLRGRVAFPLRADQTPSPTTLPKEVNELAVAGEPPMPTRGANRPLTGQTESLSSIQARKRRRALGTLGVCALAAAVLGGAAILVRSGGEPPEPATGSAVADLPAASHAPDLAPPRDLAPPDQGRPDAARPDVAAKRRRVIAPVVAGKKAAPGRPDAGAAPPAHAKAEAQAAYQEGLRRLLQGQIEEAVRLFNQALVKLPRYSLAYRGLGLAYQKLGRKPMARAAFERYLLLQPGADDVDAIRARLESLKD